MIRRAPKLMWALRTIQMPTISSRPEAGPTTRWPMKMPWSIAPRISPGWERPAARKVSRATVVVPPSQTIAEATWMNLSQR